MKKLLAIILIGCAVSAEAQQLPQFSQYVLNDYVINPAVAGTKGYFEGKSNNRYQWEGITDAPRTYTLSVNGPLKNRKVGLGGYIYTDHVGPTRRTGGALSYAYQFRLTEKKDKVSLGLSAGLLQFMVDGSKITLRDADDNLITGGVQSALIPDAGFGLYFYREKKYHIGFSAPQIFKGRIKFFKEGENPTATLARHFFFHGGYRFDLTDEVALEPLVFVKFVKPAPVQPELNLKFIYKDRIWASGGWRYLDAITASIGFNATENIGFGYSYDFPTSNIRNYSTGSHELMIAIRFHDPTPKESNENRMY